MRKWEYDYLNLLDQVLSNGELVQTRVGEAWRELGCSLSIVMAAEEFPLLTTRKMFYRPIFGELAAFLEGARFNSRFMELGCHYWTPNGRAWHRNNIMVSDENLDLGLHYGVQWRSFNGIDQLETVRKSLNTDPKSRRHILSTWNPGEIEDVCLPPCHLLCQFHTQVRHIDTALHATVYMRSVDLALGLPADIVLYYALLIVMAKSVGMTPGNLYFHFGDAHVYKEHIEGVREQIHRVPHNQRPFWVMENGIKDPLNEFMPDDITIHRYSPAEAIKYELLV